ncbi:DUF2461 domain-containing protein [Mucilaginibacter boryungensis]|uniref:DUF2461 domain-containing protein n=1 Tax=Mucilaginibacter boryungensis TaxID=768480 RepID=A0ABR9XFI2_9SPHI|nr:DUF2461 domain-containing protein [Mucilaginibacter boryungensis]MBE9666153.1 DUF2461 domain-containing protein [Mucilaginibacter boryungensis]
MTENTLPVFPKSSFDFMGQLQSNNNREWFALNKEVYQDEKQKVEFFLDELLNDLNKHDVIETPSARKSLYRVYRDIRFSKDKTPFCPGWLGRFKRATKYRRGGYYYHFEPGHSFVIGGFWGPSAQDLKLVRDDIAFDATPLRNILQSQSFKSTFGTLQGDKLKTTPKGYPADHEAIDLLRYKQYLIIRRFTDEEVLSRDFFMVVSQALKNMRPFFDYMSEVLTVDVNGLPL